jgi:hypothetical protein
MKYNSVVKTDINEYMFSNCGKVNSGDKCLVLDDPACMNSINAAISAGYSGPNITVVEIDKKVCCELKKYCSLPINIQHGCVFDYLKNSQSLYRCIFLDLMCTFFKISADTIGLCEKQIAKNGALGITVAHRGNAGKNGKITVQAVENRMRKRIEQCRKETGRKMFLQRVFPYRQTNKSMLMVFYLIRFDVSEVPTVYALEKYIGHKIRNGIRYNKFKWFGYPKPTTCVHGSNMSNYLFDLLQ